MVVASPFAVELLRLPPIDAELVVVALPFAVELLRLPPIGAVLVVVASPFAVELFRLPPIGPALVVVALPFAVELLMLPPTDAELVTVALPFAVELLMLPPIGPVLVVVAPPFAELVFVEPVTVPKLLVVTFFAASELLTVASVPTFVQTVSVAFVVQTNSAEAGSLAAQIRINKRHATTDGRVRQEPRRQSSHHMTPFPQEQSTTGGPNGLWQICHITQPFRLFGPGSRRVMGNP